MRDPLLGTTEDGRCWLADLPTRPGPVRRGTSDPSLTQLSTEFKMGAMDGCGIVGKAGIPKFLQRGNPGEDDFSRGHFESRRTGSIPTAAAVTSAGLGVLRRHYTLAAPGEKPSTHTGITRGLASLKNRNDALVSLFRNPGTDSVTKVATQGEDKRKRLPERVPCESQTGVGDDGNMEISLLHTASHTSSMMRLVIGHQQPSQTSALIHVG